MATDHEPRGLHPRACSCGKTSMCHKHNLPERYIGFDNGPDGAGHLFHDCAQCEAIKDDEKQDSPDDPDTDYEVERDEREPSPDKEYADAWARRIG